MTAESERINIVLTARDREFSAAMDRVTARLAKMEKAATRDLSNTSRAWGNMGKAAKQSSQDLTGFFNMSRGGRFVLQNTTAQLGDMAVQFESGTAASRIMAQQLPQLFGGFAALGGALGLVMPLLGTFAAIAIPSVAAFYAMSGGADDATEKVQTFAEKLTAAEAAIGRAAAAAALAGAGGLDDLKARYGEASEAVRDLAQALADIERRAAEMEIKGVLDDALGSGFQAELDRAFGSLGGAIVNAGSAAAAENVAAMRAEIEALEAQILTFTATGQQVPAALTAQLAEMNGELAALEGRVADLGPIAGELIASPETLARLDEFRTKLEEARAAGDFAGMADALSAIRQALAATGAEIEQAVIDGLALAEDQARLFSTELEESAENGRKTGDAVSGIAAALSPGVAEAARLADQLGISLARARALARVQAGLGVNEVNHNGLDPDDPRNPNNTRPIWDGETGTASPFAPSRTRAKGRAGGGRSSSGGGRSSSGGGRSGSVTAEAREYERTMQRLADLYEHNEGASASYRAALEELNAQHAAGEISGDEFSAAVKDVGDAFQDAARRADGLRRQSAQAFADIVTGARSASEALSGLLGGVASKFANAAFGGLFKSSGLFDSLSGLLSFEGGGYTGAGPRTGGVDGKGGFPVILHPNETVIDHTRGQAGAASAGGAGPVNLIVQVSGARGNQEIKDMARAGAVEVLGEFNRKTLPGRVQDIQNNPRRRS